jgi:fibronectin type 3 domain-containing protein
MAYQAPKIPAVPVVQDSNLASFLSSLKSAVEATTSATAPPQAVTGMKVTPIAGANVVQFVRSNATNFRLYASSTNDRSAASIIDLGSNNSYTDNVGQGGITRYYWVEAISHTSSSPSPLVGPLSATTLALGTSATVTPPSQPSYGTVYDTTIGTNRPIVFGTDFIPPGKQAQ